MGAATEASGSNTGGASMIASKSKRNISPRTKRYSNKLHAFDSPEDRPEVSCLPGNEPHSPTDSKSFSDSGEQSSELIDSLLDLDSGEKAQQPGSHTNHVACLEEIETARSFAGLDISELESLKDEKIDWVVEGVFGSDQPIVFGAASKSTKTLQLADLAVALAKRRKGVKKRKWLGCFDIPRRKRVLFITAESNERATARTLAKAVKSHGTSFQALSGWLHVNAVDVPKLAYIEDLAAIKADVAKYGFDVVILDPLYPSLAGLDSKQMEDRGSVIRELFQAVQPAALIYAHHLTKSASRAHGVRPCLEDLSGAGLAESAGNWWLMRRNVAYQGNMEHDLIVLYGGRDGQAGTKRILFNEEEWTFDVQDYDAYVTEKVQLDSHKKAEKEQSQHKANCEKLLAHMKTLDGATAKTTIRDGGPIKGQAFKAAFETLRERGQAVSESYKDGSNRTQQGWIVSSTACPQTAAVEPDENGWDSDEFDEVD